MGSSSKCRVQVEFEYHFLDSGRFRVPIMSDIPQVLGDFGYSNTSLLMGSGLGQIWVLKISCFFLWILGFQLPEPITIQELLPDLFTILLSFVNLVFLLKEFIMVQL